MPEEKEGDPPRCFGGYDSCRVWRACSHWKACGSEAVRRWLEGLGNAEDANLVYEAEGEAEL